MQGACTGKQSCCTGSCTWWGIPMHWECTDLPHLSLLGHGAVCVGFMEMCVLPFCLLAYPILGVSPVKTSMARRGPSLYTVPAQQGIGQGDTGVSDGWETAKFSKNWGFLTHAEQDHQPFPLEKGKDKSHCYRSGIHAVSIHTLQKK